MSFYILNSNGRFNIDFDSYDVILLNNSNINKEQDKQLLFPIKCLYYKNTYTIDNYLELYLLLCIIKITNKQDRIFEEHELIPHVPPTSIKSNQEVIDDDEYSKFQDFISSLYEMKNNVDYKSIIKLYSAEYILNQINNNNKDYLIKYICDRKMDNSKLKKSTLRDKIYALRESLEIKKEKIAKKMEKIQLKEEKFERNKKCMEIIKGLKEKRQKYYNYKEEIRKSISKNEEQEIILKYAHSRKNYQFNNNEILDNKRKMYQETKYEKDYEKINMKNKLTKEKKLLYGKIYRYINKEKIAEKKKKLREKNLENEENIEKMREYAKIYRENNKEYFKELGKKYREKNKEKIAEYGKKYRENKLKKDIMKKEYNEIDKEKDEKAEKHKEILAEKLKIYLENINKN